jgi:hypothetical protein
MSTRYNTRYGSATLHSRDSGSNGFGARETIYTFFFSEHDRYVRVVVDAEKLYHAGLSAECVAVDKAVEYMEPYVAAYEVKRAILWPAKTRKLRCAGALKRRGDWRSRCVVAMKTNGLAT